MKLIDKDALVAKIERMIKHYNESVKEFGDEGYKDNVLMEQGKANVCKRILSFLDTLEVKEVDIEKELNDYGYHYDYVSLADRKELVNFAKYFFELGLKAQKGEEYDRQRN